MSPRPFKIPRSVLVVIHTPALEVLLIERADRPGFWQSVTGALDAPDEPLALTARREVAEETGIEGGALCDWRMSNIYEIYAHWRHRYAPGVTHNTEHVFGLRLDGRVPVTLNPREHLQHEWLPWQEAAERCFSPTNREAILKLGRRFAGRRGSGSGSAGPERSPSGGPARLGGPQGAPPA